MKKLEVMQTKCKTFATKFGFLRQHATNQVLFSKEEIKAFVEGLTLNS